MIKFWSPRDRGVWKKFRPEAVLSVREGFRKGGIFNLQRNGRCIMLGLQKILCRDGERSMFYGI